MGKEKTKYHGAWNMKNDAEEMNFYEKDSFATE